MKLRDLRGREYTKELYRSLVKMVAGSANIQYFKKTTGEDKNYSNETNPFSSTHGGVISAIKAHFFDTDYSDLVISKSTIAKIQAISIVRNSGMIEIKRGKDLLVSIPLSKILAPYPTLFIGEKVGAIVDYVEPAPIPLLRESLNEKYVYDLQKEVGQELYFGVKEQLDITLTFMGGVTVPTAIQGCILSIELETRPFTSPSTKPAPEKRMKQMRRV